MRRTVVAARAARISLFAAADTTAVVRGGTGAPTTARAGPHTVAATLGRKDASMSSRELRLLARAAVAGGACWITLALWSLLTASASQDNPNGALTGAGDYFGFTVFALALGLTVAGLLALHLHQRGADGRLGRAGAAVAMLGCAAQCVVIVGVIVNGEDTSWFGIAAPLAILTWILGSVAFGIATRRAGVLPRWVGTALPLVTLVAIVGSEYGTSVLIGAFLIAVGTRIATAAGATLPPVGARAAEAR
jgi:hypothetical protein